MILYPDDCDLIQDHMVEQCEDCYRFYVCKREHDKQQEEQRKDDST